LPAAAADALTGRGNARGRLENLLFLKKKLQKCIDLGDFRKNENKICEISLNYRKFRIFAKNL
jgi:hypothetical protein